MAVNNFIFKNNVETTAVQAIAPGDLSITLQAGAGVLFGVLIGTQYIAATLTQGSLIEIIHVTNVVGDVLTIERAKESTTAETFAINAKVSVNLTAGALQNIRASIKNTETAISSLDSDMADAQSDISASQTNIQNNTDTINSLSSLPVLTGTIPPNTPPPILHQLYFDSLYKAWYRAKATGGTGGNNWDLIHTNGRFSRFNYYPPFEGTSVPIGRSYFQADTRRIMTKVKNDPSQKDYIYLADSFNANLKPKFIQLNAFSNGNTHVARFLGQDLVYHLETSNQTGANRDIIALTFPDVPTSPNAEAVGHCVLRFIVENAGGILPIFKYDPQFLSLSGEYDEATFQGTPPAVGKTALLEVSLLNDGNKSLSFQWTKAAEFI